MVSLGSVVRWVMVACLAGQCGCGYRLLREGEPAVNTTMLMPKATTITTQYYPGAQAPKGVPLNLIPESCDESRHPDLVRPTQPEISDCVYALKSIIDDRYREYRITLHHFADAGNSVADITAFAFSTAATGPISSVAKSVLSGLSAFVTGSKTAINEDVLYKQSIELILDQMDADRYQQASVIKTQITAGNYSLYEAKDDLLAYLMDGTFDHALSSLPTKVAANKANCQAQLANTKIQPNTTEKDGVGGLPYRISRQGATKAGAAPAAIATGCPAPSATSASTDNK